MAASTSSQGGPNGPDHLRASLSAGARAGAGALPGQANLWTSILDDVSTRRQKGSVPTRNLIVLGERRAGKSTLVQHLASPSGPSSASGAAGKAAGAQRLTAGRSDGETDGELGMRYSTVDVGDEGDEDALARLSVHQIPSSSPPYSGLLPLTLTASNLSQSLVVVVLPLTRPHALLSSLARWLSLLSSVIASIRSNPGASSVPADASQGASRGERGEVVIEDAKERLEAEFRAYSDPSSSRLPPSSPSRPSASGVPPTTTSSLSTSLPLPPGTLTSNLGVPILVVCTKSDALDQLERSKELKEEQFDYLQQALRTVCLRYGAGLWFVSQGRKESFERLRSYILHRSFGSSASPPTATGTGATSGQGKKSFAFGWKPNVVDRDAIMVPCGWDSWGKIKVLREGFDPAVVADGWEEDMRREERRRAAKGQAEEEDKGAGAVAMWEAMIADPDEYRPIAGRSSSRQTPAHAGGDRIVAAPDQDFFKTHFERMAKDPVASSSAKDPRSHFQPVPTSNRPSPALGAGVWSPTMNGDERVPGVVGPMGATSLGLPGVERALAERDGVDEGAAKMVKKDSTQSNGRSSAATGRPDASRPSRSQLTSPNLGSSATMTPSASSTSAAAAAVGLATGGGVAGRGDKEALQSFFDKLLKKDGASTGATGAGAAAGARGVRSPPVGVDKDRQPNGRSA